MKIKQVAEVFLGLDRIAVTGECRDPQGRGGNTAYTRLRERGYQVFAVNPTTEEVGATRRTQPGLRPGRCRCGGHRDGGLPRRRTMQQVIDRGIRYAWMRCSFGASSVGVTVIEGVRPLMFGKDSDGGHRFMCRLLTVTGKVPREVRPWGGPGWRCRRGTAGAARWPARGTTPNPFRAISRTSCPNSNPCGGSSQWEVHSWPESGGSKDLIRRCRRLGRRAIGPLTVAVAPVRCRTRVVAGGCPDLRVDHGPPTGSPHGGPDNPMINTEIRT
jgi:hypothetical protein